MVTIMEKKKFQLRVQNLTDVDLILKYKVSEKHAAQFGRLVIQDEGGRMKPINTFSSELLRKVSKKDTYEDMNSDQVFVSMTQFGLLGMKFHWFILKVETIVLEKLSELIKRKPMLH